MQSAARSNDTVYKRSIKYSFYIFFKQSKYTVFLKIALFEIFNLDIVFYTELLIYTTFLVRITARARSLRISSFLTVKRITLRQRVIKSNSNSRSRLCEEHKIQICGDTRHRMVGPSLPNNLRNNVA